MTSQPIFLPSYRETKRAAMHRCERLGLSRERADKVTRVIVRAMDAGASPARAYADACSAIRDAQRHNGQPPRGAA